MPNLPNEDREKRFVATGPNQEFTVRGVTGFYTDATQLEFGVNAQGNKCGVYGESVTDDSGRTLPDPGDGQSVRTGVCGVGGTYGVIGAGSQVAGVYGQHEASGAGVIGVGRKQSVTGVIGASIDPRRASSRKKSIGIGVKGASNNGRGFGVVGVSVKDLAIGSNPVPGLTDGDGDGTGVMGSSGTGTGVRGRSGDGHGGVFESGKGAQINLKPLFETATPPFNGQAGDLLVITKMREDNPTGGFAELWFCIREDASNEGAIWGKVQFSETFQAR